VPLPGNSTNQGASDDVNQSSEEAVQTGADLLSPFQGRDQWFHNEWSMF